jgi:hypothetical protein
LGWIKSEVYEIKVDTPEELLAPFWMLLPEIKKIVDQLRRQATSDLRTRVTRCIEVDGGNFESLL